MTGYAVFMDDGASGSYSEVNSANDVAVRDQPLLSAFTITAFTVADEGKDFRVYLTVFTAEYELSSEVATITLADVPGTPAAGPTRDSTSTSTILYVSIGTVTDINGLTLTAYSIEADLNDGLGYTLIQEGMATYATLKNLVQGSTYKLRYRVKNDYGYSDYSPVSFLLAAEVPETPNAPTFTSSTDEDLIVALDLVANNMGSAITTWKLYINAGDGLDTYTQVASYISGTASHTLNDITDTLTEGKIYKLKVSATNAIGESE